MTDEPIASDVGPLDPAPSLSGAGFYAEFFPRLVRMLGPLCPDQDTAQDIAQETLVGVWERPELLDPGRPAWPWLRTVARHKALDHVRGTARRSRILREQLQPTFDSASEPVHRLVERDALRQAMRDVPERHRRALTLRHVLDWSPEQIAEHLGVNRNAADQLLHRARRSLRRSYERACAALWLLWPGRWRNTQRALDAKTLEVGVAGGVLAERTLVVVVATIVAVGSAVAAGGVDMAQGASRPSPAANVPAPSPQVPPPPAADTAQTGGQARPASPSTKQDPQPPASVKPGRPVLDIGSREVQHQRQPATAARAHARAEDNRLVIEDELQIYLPSQREPGEADTEDDSEPVVVTGDGGTSLSCDGPISAKLCETVEAPQ